ncbi:MAG: hypothetical protein ACJAW3_001338 [Lentimonas sp.]|jgi:hypothetical protein
MSNNLKALRELILKSQYPEYANFCERVRLDGKYKMEECEKWMKIESKSITLAEVLMALGKLEINWYSAFNQKTMHILGYSLENPETVIADFGLHMDKDLDGQSPETIQNLLRLMEKHND